MGATALKRRQIVRHQMLARENGTYNVDFSRLDVIAHDTGDDFGRPSGRHAVLQIAKNKNRTITSADAFSHLD